MFLAAIETIEADLWLFAECGAFEEGEILGLDGCCRRGGQAPLRVRAADRDDGTGMFLSAAPICPLRHSAPCKAKVLGPLAVATSAVSPAPCVESASG
jgi:hypothetical protein